MAGGTLDCRLKLLAVLTRVSQSGTICTLGCDATCPGMDSGGRIGGTYCAAGRSSVAVTTRSSHTLLGRCDSASRRPANSRTRTDAIGSAGVFLASGSCHGALGGASFCSKCAVLGGNSTVLLTPMTTGAGVKSCEATLWSAAVSDVSQLRGIAVPVRSG